MKNERMLTPATLAWVAAVHAVLLAWGWQIKPPKPLLSGDIQFVDLAAFGSPDGGAGAAAQPAPEPAKPAAPKAQPKAAETPKLPKQPPVREKPAVKAVITDQPKADMRVPQERAPQPAKPQTPPREQPKREAAAETPGVSKAAAPSDAAAPKSAAAGEGKGEAKSQGTGKAAGSGKGDAPAGSPNGNASGGGTQAGGSAGNPVKASGSIPRPAYPPLSQENGEEGTVVLKVLVSPGGQVQKVSVAKSSGFSRLDRAASNGAKNGRFNVSAWTEFTVPVSFRLE